MTKPSQQRAVTRLALFARLRDFITSSVDSARGVELPFYHFELDERVFPEDVYASMLAVMPVAADYRPLRGRTGACVIA